MTPKWRKTIVCWLVLSPLIVTSLFPFAVMFFSAVKPRDELFIYPVRWLPSRFAWQNFANMWESTEFGGALLNSIYVSVGSTLLAIAVGIPAAYAVSRFRFRGKGLYHQFLLVTQMMSPMVLVLGLFRLMVHFNVVDSLNPVLLTYGAFNLAFTVMMLQSYFDTIPKDLEEAAWVDGATRLQSLVRIFLPLAVPAIVVTATVTFINAWNEFVFALTLLRSSENYTLQIKVFSLVAGRYQIEWHHVMAATFLATVPVAIVFSWLQRYLIRGMSLGAVK